MNEEVTVVDAQDRGAASIFIIPPTVFLVGCLFFIALLFGHRDLAVLTLLVLAMVGGAKVWSRMSLSGIKCDTTVDKQRVFPGEQITLRARVENGKFLPIWLQMTVPVGSPLRASSCETNLTQETGLFWYQRAHFQWELDAQKRGVHQIGPPHIIAGDLFGFFPGEKKTEEVLHVIVYPRLVPLRSFSLPRRDVFGLPGARSPIQDPVYVLGTRDYQHGQSAKYIHWKASARHSRLQQKIFEPTEQEKTLLILDVDPFAGKNAETEFEHTLEVLASLAVRLDQQGYAVGLVTNGANVHGGSAILPVSRNPQQLAAILEILARLELRTTGDLMDVLRQGLELSWGMSCVHFSYEDDVTALAANEFFTRRKIPIVFFVSRVQGENGDTLGEKVHRLDDIAVQGIEKK